MKCLSVNNTYYCKNERATQYQFQILKIPNFLVLMGNWFNNIRDFEHIVYNHCYCVPLSHAVSVCALIGLDAVGVLAACGHVTAPGNLRAICVCTLKVHGSSGGIHNIKVFINIERCAGLQRTMQQVGFLQDRLPCCNTSTRPFGSLVQYFASGLFHIS